MTSIPSFPGEMLSLAQVLDYLEQHPTQHNSKLKSSQSTLIQEQVRSYLTACTPKVMDRDTLHHLLVDSEGDGFGLSQTEALQIFNFMPTEHVELYALLDNLSERPDLEQRQDELLETIARYRVAESKEKNSGNTVRVKQEVSNDQ